MVVVERNNVVYPISEPKKMFGTDRRLALVVLMFCATFGAIGSDWRMWIAVIAVGSLTLAFARKKSTLDPWWFTLYQPYNRYADVYLPWSQGVESERYARPYGFSRDLKA